MKKDFKIALHFFKLTSKMSKTYLPLLCITSIVKSLMPFLNIIMPKFIIDELLGQKRIDVFVLLVSITILGNGLLNLITKWLDTKVDIANFNMVNRFELYMGQHIMGMDYENLEDPEILDLKEKAIFPINNQGALWRMFDSVLQCLQTIFTLIGLIAVVSTLNILIIVVIIAIVAINTFLLKKKQKVIFQMNKELIPLNRKFGYYADLISDFSMAKDVRIYHMAPFLIKKVDSYNKESLDSFSKHFATFSKYDGISAINLQFQMVLVYSYMVWKVLKGAIGIGDFTMYIAAANSFSGSLNNLLFQYVQFLQMCKYLDLYLEFESIPSKFRNGNKSIEKTEDIRIEFRNVSFKYPRSEEYTLKNVSLTITQGEKLSIVGQNGAGKTTFIKLLCRLYEPEQGEILLNGINIKDYSFQAYSKMMAVVFQDFKLFSFSVKENVSFDQSCDEEKLTNALQKAGVYEKIQSLSNGVDTSIYKNFDKEGVELSGGEGQKLAIARAIYKDCPVVILDEPTAALDPYAEFEIYSKFNDLVQNRTAIYISHRLSSCRFCDKIAVFDQGELVEYGSHSELEQQDGLYRKMWYTQAQYYA